MKRMKLSTNIKLLVAAQLSFICSSVAFGAQPTVNSMYYEEIVDRSYTTNVFHYPAICKSDKYSRQCGFFTNYYVSKFEHNYIGFITDHLDLENSESDQLSSRDLAYQDVKFDIKILDKLGLMCVVAHISQSYLGKESNHIEVFNFNVNTQKVVHFEDLFKDAELASMICSNIVYDKFKQYKSKDLELIKAQIEVDPRNFLLLPDGIEFILAQGIIAPPKVKSRVFVSVDKLSEAVPNKKFFPFLDGKLPADGKLEIDPIDGSPLD